MSDEQRLESAPSGAPWSAELPDGRWVWCRVPSGETTAARRADDGTLVYSLLDGERGAVDPDAAARAGWRFAPTLFTPGVEGARPFRARHVADVEAVDDGAPGVASLAAVISLAAADPCPARGDGGPCEPPLVPVAGVERLCRWCCQAARGQQSVVDALRARYARLHAASEGMAAALRRARSFVILQGGEDPLFAEPRDTPAAVPPPDHRETFRRAGLRAEQHAYRDALAVYGEALAGDPHEWPSPATWAKAVRRLCEAHAHRPVQALATSFLLAAGLHPDADRVDRLVPDEVRGPLETLRQLVARGLAQEPTT